jgi:predicted transcriptional regulator
MVSFRLHNECIEALKAKAEASGQSQSAVVELALAEAGLWTPGEAAGQGGKDERHS